MFFFRARGGGGGSRLFSIFLGAPKKRPVEGTHASFEVWVISSRPKIKKWALYEWSKKVGLHNVSIVLHRLGIMSIWRVMIRTFNLFHFWRF